MTEIEKKRLLQMLNDCISTDIIRSELRIGAETIRDFKLRTGWVQPCWKCRLPIEGWTLKSKTRVCQPCAKAGIKANNARKRIGRISKEKVREVPTYFLMVRCPCSYYQTMRIPVGTTPEAMPCPRCGNKTLTRR